MRILGIETSCDETSVAIVEGHGEQLAVRKHLVASQVKIHARYGGVVPEVAAREHLPKLLAMLPKAVARDGKGIDAIAVTAGPGLVTSLRVGVDVARTLAWSWRKPLVAVNHLEGHIYANWLGTPSLAKERACLPAGRLGRVTQKFSSNSPNPSFQEGNIRFPALVLIVSGGHTELVLMTGHGRYRLLGATRDDAVGEAFDKVAKMLGLGYPGGPAVARRAARGRPDAVALPRPMMKDANYEFSFSGLKTAVLYASRDWSSRRQSALDRTRAYARYSNDLCASFEQAAVDVLIAKTIRAAREYRVKTVLLAGGVSANLRLRLQLGEAIGRELPITRYLLPDLAYTTDNAAMIAAAGYFNVRRRKLVDPLKLEPRAQWELGSFTLSS